MLSALLKGALGGFKPICQHLCYFTLRFCCKNKNLLCFAANLSIISKALNKPSPGIFFPSVSLPEENLHFKPFELGSFLKHTFSGAAFSILLLRRPWIFKVERCTWSRSCWSSPWSVFALGFSVFWANTLQIFLLLSMAVVGVCS